MFFIKLLSVFGFIAILACLGVKGAGILIAGGLFFVMVFMMGGKKK